MVVTFGLARVLNELCNSSLEFYFSGQWMPITLDDSSFFSLYMSVKRSVSILNWFPPISNSEKVTEIIIMHKYVYFHLLFLTTPPLINFMIFGSNLSVITIIHSYLVCQI